MASSPCYPLFRRPSHSPALPKARLSEPINYAFIQASYVGCPSFASGRFLTGILAKWKLGLKDSTPVEQ